MYDTCCSPFYLYISRNVPRMARSGHNASWVELVYYSMPCMQLGGTISRPPLKYAEVLNFRTLIAAVSGFHLPRANAHDTRIECVEASRRNIGAMTSLAYMSGNGAGQVRAPSKCFNDGPSTAEPALCFVHDHL